MSDGTHIEWTDASWNPIRALRTDYEVKGWHCERVSSGCQNCYAETLNVKRFGTGLLYNRKSRDAVELFLDETALTKPLHWRKPRKVFVCSMTDLFGEWVPDEWIDRVFAVMALAPQHTFQVLTKRPERMRAWAASKETPARVDVQSAAIVEGRSPLTKANTDAFAAFVSHDATYSPKWPLPNVWMMTSVENQTEADRRIPELLATPAAVRGLSCEPLLGRLDLRLDEEELCGPGPDDSRKTRCGLNGLHWVIVGGESGPGARPCDVGWVRSIVAQCQAAAVPVFYKQGGSAHRCPHSAKGGCFDCMPEDLQRREFPNAVYGSGLFRVDLKYQKTCQHCQGTKVEPR